MPYTPPTPRAAIASQPNTKFQSCCYSSPKSQKGNDRFSDHGSRMKMHALPSLRANSVTYRTGLSISKPHSLTSGLSTPHTMALETSSPDSDDTDETQIMAISPHVLPRISPEDEAPTRRGRPRKKPNPVQPQAGDKIKTTPTNFRVPHPRKDLSDKEITSKSELSPSVSPSGGVRKNMQSKSEAGANARPAFPRDKFASGAGKTPENQSSDSEYEKLPRKPKLIHKKSGELVPSALRASSRMRRHSSSSIIPRRPKAVHFQENDLEHICLFLRGERPTAVSASSSPVDIYKNEICSLSSNNEWRSRSPPFEWEMLLNHFPRQCFERTLLPVRVESVYLSSDTKVLIGTVAVSNFAFYKSVVTRFTFDHWKTTSEVVADFDHNIVESQTKDGCDRFVFKINLEDQSHLEDKTMFFCVRYNVGFQEYWDNNNLSNYQVNFSRRIETQDRKPCTQAKNACVPNAAPCSKASPSASSGFHSTIPSDDSMSLDWFPSPFQPPAIIGTSPGNLEEEPCAKHFAPHAPGSWTDPDNQHAFANRYNFDTSLAEAVQAGHAAVGDRSRVRLEKHVTPAYENLHPSQNQMCEGPRISMIQGSVDAGIPIMSSEANQPFVPDRPKPVGVIKKNSVLRSHSYSELLDKYCFCGNEKLSSHAAEAAPRQLTVPG